MIKTEKKIMWAIIDPVTDKAVMLGVSKEAAERLVQQVKFVGVTVEKVQAVVTRVTA